MIDKARAHETLDMLIGAMGAERDSAARKRVEDLREYVTSLESEWQPIETAPKDGTRVLLFSRDSGQFVGRYGNGVWIVASFHDSVACASWVTHWKPLGPNPET